MNEISTFISSVGFPIAVGTGCLYVAYKIGMKLFERAISAFDTITRTNEELVKTNSVFASKIDKIDKIENKIDIVIEKLDSMEV